MVVCPLNLGPESSFSGWDANLKVTVIGITVAIEVETQLSANASERIQKKKPCELK